MNTYSFQFFVLTFDDGFFVGANSVFFEQRLYQKNKFENMAAPDFLFPKNYHDSKESFRGIM